MESVILSPVLPCTSLETSLQSESFMHSCMNSLSSTSVGLPRRLSEKTLPANSGDPRDIGSIPGRGRSPGRGNGNPLQYSCLKNLVDRGAGWATVHGLQKVEHDQVRMHASLVDSIFMNLPIIYLQPQN